MAKQALAVYQNFLYSFWSSWKIFLGSFLNPRTIYKTAHLKVFYWLLDVPSVAFASISPYSKKNSTAHTPAVSVKSILYWKKKSCHYKQLFSCSARTFTATFLSPQLFSCQCAPSLNVSTRVHNNDKISNLRLYIHMCMHIHKSSYFLTAVISGTWRRLATFGKLFTQNTSPSLTATVNSTELKDETS